MKTTESHIELLEALKKKVFDKKVLKTVEIECDRILFDGYNKIAGGRLRAFNTKEDVIKYLVS